MERVRALTGDAVGAFAVFARHCNFTHAAEELHLAQPSLHAKISKLSRALGTTLYERVGRELVLTADGEALATYAADQQRLAEDLLGRLDRAGPRMRLVTGRAALRRILDRPLRRLVDRGVDLSVSPLDRSAALAEVITGKADVAAIGYDPPPRHLASRHLRSVPQVLLISRPHRLATASSIGVAELQGLALVVPPPGRPHRQSLERSLAAARVEWSVASEADGWDVIVHLTSLGLGAAVVNGCVPVPEPLIAVPITDLPAVGYWLAWREQRQATVQPLLDELDAT
jgi:DNA-binding transcriptional LysR family regulator